MEEKWVFIDGSDNAYISNFGRVKRNNVFVNLREADGFLVATVGGAQKQVYIHRAVAKYFLDKPEVLNSHVIHKDGNRNNNVYINLEYQTKRSSYSKTLKNGDDNEIIRQSKYKKINNNTNNSKLAERLGQKRTNGDGVVGEIIGCKRHNNNNSYVIKLDNKFETIVYATWAHFIQGKFGMRIAGRHVGEKRKSADGYIAEVTQYNSIKDFDIKFEDDQEIRHMKNWQDFKNGHFRKYRFGMLFEDEIQRRLTIHRFNKQGYGMKIKAFRKASDIDIIFDDGEVVLGTYYGSFESGNVFHPIYKSLKKEKLDRILLNKKIEKIIKYQNKDDIDVLLKNGEVRNITYDACIRFNDRIGDSDLLNQSEIQRRKQIVKKKNGHTCHIDIYHRDNTVDIVFDDGKIVKNVKWVDFRDGEFEYPDEIEKIKKRLIKHIMHGYKAGARKRKLSFELTLDEFTDLILQPCAYTGIPYSNTMKYGDFSLNYNGIDRINSDIGYVKGNVVPCCININKAKSNLPVQDFFELIKKTYNYLEAQYNFDAKRIA